MIMETELPYTSFPDNTTIQPADNYSCEYHHLYLPPYHHVTYIFEAYIHIPVFALGIITNIFTIYVLRHMMLGKICMMLLCALGITDLLACITGFISTTMEIVIFHGEMPFGYFCPWAMETYSFFFMFMMFLSMSHTIVIVVTAIRVYTMSKPLESRSSLTKRNVAKGIAALYIVIFIIFLPVAFYILWQSCFEDTDRVPFCHDLFKALPKITISKYYLGMLMAIFGPLVVVANLISLVLLRRAMRKTTREGASLRYRRNNENHMGSSARKLARITQVLFYVLLVNTICIVPICLQTAMLQWNPENVFSKESLVGALFDVIAETMLQVIPCYNFWTYLIVNKDFRKKFRKLVMRQKVEEDSSDMTFKDRSRNGSHTSTSISLIRKPKNHAMSEHIEY